MSGKADEELVPLFFANSLDLAQVMLTKKKKSYATNLFKSLKDTANSSIINAWTTRENCPVVPNVNHPISVHKNKSAEHVRVFIQLTKML